MANDPWPEKNELVAEHSSVFFLLWIELFWCFGRPAKRAEAANAPKIVFKPIITTRYRHLSEFFWTAVILGQF